MKFRSTLKVRPYSGYHLVSDDVGDHHPEAVTSTTSTTTSATPWVVSKMSSYSLLSASDDSLAVEEDVVDVDRMGDRLPCMIRASLTSSASSEKDAEGAERLRTSESVHTFSWASTAPAVRWGVPRSMTTMRFNPFDASMASKTSVGGRRQEVETTSDYASEMDVDSSTCSVIGINNPNYEEFHAHRNAFLNGKLLNLIQLQLISFHFIRFSHLVRFYHLISWIGLSCIE